MDPQLRSPHYTLAVDSNSLQLLQRPLARGALRRAPFGTISPLIGAPALGAGTWRHLSFLPQAARLSDVAADLR